MSAYASFQYTRLRDQVQGENFKLTHYRSTTYGDGLYMGDFELELFTSKLIYAIVTLHENPSLHPVGR